MRRDEALRILKEHEGELRERGVVHMRIFGSVARDEANMESDVDLLADFDPERRLGLIAVSSIQVRLSEIFQATVDLSSPSWLKPRVYEQGVGACLLETFADGLRISLTRR